MYAKSEGLEGYGVVLEKLAAQNTEGFLLEKVGEWRCQMSLENLKEVWGNIRGESGLIGPRQGPQAHEEELWMVPEASEDGGETEGETLEVACGLEVSAEPGTGLVEVSGIGLAMVAVELNHAGEGFSPDQLRLPRLPRGGFLLPALFEAALCFAGHPWAARSRGGVRR